MCRREVSLILISVEEERVDLHLKEDGSSERGGGGQLRRRRKLKKTFLIRKLNLWKAENMISSYPEIEVPPFPL